MTVPPWLTVLGHTPWRRTAAFTDLSVDRGSLAPRGFLGSEGSQRCMGTVRTCARAPAREGMPSTEAAGKSPGRWRCVAWEAHCGGRRCGTWPEGWAGGYIHCALARGQAAALGWERNQWIRIEHWLVGTKSSGHLLFGSVHFFMIKLCFLETAHPPFSALIVKLPIKVSSFPRKWAGEAN